MASNGKLYYQRLKHEDGDEDEDLREKVIGRLRSSRFRRFHVKRRSLRVRIPGLKRFLRRKAKLVRTAWSKVCRRLKESQAHFGDLFAGNYLFMQVTPTPFKYGDNYGGNNNNKSFVRNYGVINHGLSSPRLSFPRVT